MDITALTLGLGGRIAPLGLADSTVALTVAFGLGQIIGPVFAGLMASRTHGFALAEASASVIVLVGAVSWHPCCPRHAAPENVRGERGKTGRCCSLLATHAHTATSLCNSLERGETHRIPHRSGHHGSRRNQPCEVDELRAAEAERAAELAKAGHMVRLWRPPLGPGEWRSIGLFRAADEAELRAILASLPLHIWMVRHHYAAEPASQ